MHRDRAMYRLHVEFVETALEGATYALSFVPSSPLYQLEVEQMMDKTHVHDLCECSLTIFRLMFPLVARLIPCFVWCVNLRHGYHLILLWPGRSSMAACLL